MELQLDDFAAEAVLGDVGLVPLGAVVLGDVAPCERRVDEGLGLEFVAERVGESLCGDWVTRLAVAGAEIDQWHGEISAGVIHAGVGHEHDFACVVQVNDVDMVVL